MGKLGDSFFHQFPDFPETVFGSGLKAQDQDGLGVRSPNQSPTVREKDPHAIHIHDRVFITE